MAILAREVSSFYRPDEMLTEWRGEELEKLIKIRRFLVCYSHPSIKETKRMVAGGWFTDVYIANSLRYRTLAY